MPGIKLHFWNWDTPVLDKAVLELTTGWSGGELDLSHLAIIVPTAEAVRRLKEALALAAEARYGAVTAPHVWHPEAALLSGRRDEVVAVATRLEERVAWMQVLEKIHVTEYSALFPVMPAHTGSSWALAVGEMLVTLRASLGGGGHDLHSVAALMKGHEDGERWDDLMRLEDLYWARLKEMSRADSQTAKRLAAESPRLPDSVKELLVLAAPDLTGLMRTWLQSAARRLPVRIFVHAPESERKSFDELGQPLATVWGDAAGRWLPVQDDMLVLASTPEDQAREAVSALRTFVSQKMTAATGSCDPELNPGLESELAAEGVTAYDPAGRLAEQHALLDLLRSWLSLLESGAWKTLATFLRRHDVLAALSEFHGVKPADLLNDLDDLHQKRLPATLEDACQLCDAAEHEKLRAVLDDIARHAEAWKGDGSISMLRALLSWIYAAQTFDTSHEHDRGMVELVGEIMNCALALDAGLGGETLKGSTWLGLLLAEAGQLKLGDLRGEADLVLHGWLELLWEPARGLVVAGFNDEQVPGVLAPDPFLPDSLRKKLGLACAESRRVRDAFLLTAIAEQRRQDGALRLIVGRRSDEGDVLRPSRLLFACDDAALLRRVDLLFPKQDGSRISTPHPPASILWKLRPPRPEVNLKKVSASLLSAYLRCPLRCYFSHILRMREVSGTARELDGKAFGELVHEVWKRFATEPKLHGTKDEALLAGFLAETADQVAREKYGARPLFSVAMQVESAKQRLRSLAAAQLRLWQEGWTIEHAELELQLSDGLLLAGVPFIGRIDRVDRHVQTGALRVWDYKTGPQGDAARDHLESTPLIPGAEHDVQWRALEISDGRARVWKNLQLPLYVLAMQQRHPGLPVEAGYLHLPAVVSEVGEKLWKNLDEAMLRSAHDCAAEAVRRMQSGHFWPPQEVKFDDWDEFFMGDVTAAVAPVEEWREDAA